LKFFSHILSLRRLQSQKLRHRPVLPLSGQKLGMTSCCGATRLDIQSRLFIGREKTGIDSFPMEVINTGYDLICIADEDRLCQHVER
jgi:hypothetical protein